MNRLLRIVLFVHGLITLAGAVVLTVWPAAVPSMVGITLTEHDYLVVYLLAAAELGAAVLSFGALRLSDRAAIALIVTTLVVWHGASGLLNLLYLGQTGFNTTLVANTGARAAAVLAVLISWRSSRN